MHVAPSSASIADLTWLNIADIFSAFGVRRDLRLRGPIELLLRAPARRFAVQMATLDATVGAAGLGAGGAWICGQLARSVTVVGPAPPAEGPLLVTANHPGLLDAAALFMSIPRPDLRVLAITRPFLRSLPHIAAALIPVGDGPAARMAALRTAARHLRSGGALLTFPAGQIEPDPLTLPGAAESVAGWSDSVELLARLAGAATVVPAIVGGVLSPAALRHPLVRLRRSPAERQWLAAILQLMLPQLGHVAVRVHFGQPIAGAAPLGPAVAAQARTLIEGIGGLR